MYVLLSMYCEEPRKPWGNVQGADEDLRKRDCWYGHRHVKDRGLRPMANWQSLPSMGQARNWQSLPLLWVGMLAVDGPLCANTSHCGFLLQDTCNLRPPACRSSYKDDLTTHPTPWWTWSMHCVPGVLWELLWLYQSAHNPPDLSISVYMSVVPQCHCPLFISLSHHLRSNPSCARHSDKRRLQEFNLKEIKGLN